MFFTATSSFAQTYHAGDIVVINSIIDNNGLKWTKANPADGSYVPADWTGIEWSGDVTDKYVGGLNIQDQSPELTGVLDVSGLSNLYYLYCSSNQLTDINVSGQINLHSLFCWGNQLTKLDVSGLHNLYMFDCGGNQLKELDLTGLNDLYHLGCTDNQLTELDVSGLKNLYRIYCTYNQLTKFDASGLSDLKELSCGENQLTELNVSGLSSLQSLDCGSNSLTKLDVSDLNILQKLTCNYNSLTELDVSGLSCLQELDCSRNKLAELDISKLSNLESFSCGGNQLTELDVAGLSSLQELYCWGNKLTELDLTGLTDLTDFSGSNQTPSIAMKGSENSYTANIPLNNPSNLVDGLSYASGVLTSNSNTIMSSLFTVQTGLAGFELSGSMYLTYSTNSIDVIETNMDSGAYWFGGRLHVFSPVAETIQVYSTNGAMLYNFEKAAGTANYPVDKSQSGILIVRGSSGWVEKVIK